VTITRHCRDQVEPLGDVFANPVHLALTARAGRAVGLDHDLFPRQTLPAAVLARLNPIEQLFAKLKALLRKAAARTRDQLWTTIGHLLATISPAECAHYLHHCGYSNGST
jgi:hypothetical protein